MNRILQHKRFRTLIKFSVVGGLLYYLAQRGFLNLEATGQALKKWDLTAPAFLALFAGSVMAIFRWQMLLRAHGIHLPFLRTLQLTCVGFFFNIALPGAVSGDVVKAIYVAREIRGQRAQAFGSILFDRLLGLSALVLIGAVALFGSMGSAWGNHLFQALQVFVGSAGLGVVVFYGYLFLVGPRKDPLLQILKRLEKAYPFLGSFTRIYEGIRHYRNHRGVVVLTLIMSIVIHSLVMYACLNFSRAIGEVGVAPLAVAVVVPLGLLVTAIPIMPAGVGTGHAAFLALFHLLGSERGADIFNMYVLYQLSLGALGGLIYLRFKTVEPIPEVV